MITIDIVSPVGGLYGGVENVIKLLKVFKIFSRFCFK